MENPAGRGSHGSDYRSRVTVVVLNDFRAYEGDYLELQELDMSKPTSLRLPDKIFAALSAESRRRGVPFPDFTRACLERGLYAEMMTHSCLREAHITAVYETRNLLRRLVAARSQKDVIEARVEAELQMQEERS